MIFVTTSRSTEIILVLNVDYLVKVIHEVLNIWQFKARVYAIYYPVGGK